MLVKRHAEAIRSPPGHARPAHSQDHCARAAARMGDLQANPAAFRRRAVGAAGLPLSGAHTARASRLDHRGVEGYGPWTEREILFADSGRPPAARARAGELEAA